MIIGTTSIHGWRGGTLLVLTASCFFHASRSFNIDLMNVVRMFTRSSISSRFSGFKRPEPLSSMLLIRFFSALGCIPLHARSDLSNSESLGGGDHVETQRRCVAVEMLKIYLIKCSRQQKAIFFCTARILNRVQVCAPSSLDSTRRSPTWLWCLLSCFSSSGPW